MWRTAPALVTFGIYKHQRMIIRWEWKTEEIRKMGDMASNKNCRISNSVGCAT